MMASDKHSQQGQEHSNQAVKKPDFKAPDHDLVEFELLIN